MAVKTVQYVFNGQTYDLTFDASTGEYKAAVPAPSKSSYSQDGHKYGGSVIATDDAGNSTTITQSDATLEQICYFASLKKLHRHLSSLTRQLAPTLPMQHRLLNSR